MICALKPHKQTIWSVLSKNLVMDKKEVRMGVSKHEALLSMCEMSELLCESCTNIAKCPATLVI